MPPVPAREAVDPARAEVSPASELVGPVPEAGTAPLGEAAPQV
jgi:hypothetical protein